MPCNKKSIDCDELARGLLAIWDMGKRAELQVKDPNGRMKAMTELISKWVGPEEAAGYASAFIAEFANYDITYDNASPGEGSNETAMADRQIRMVKMLREEFEE